MLAHALRSRQNKSAVALCHRLLEPARLSYQLHANENRESTDGREIFSHFIVKFKRFQDILLDALIGENGVNVVLFGERRPTATSRKR